MDEEQLLGVWHVPRGRERREIHKVLVRKSTGNMIL
jgi:hypothetical protein